MMSKNSIEISRFIQREVVSKTEYLPASILDVGPGDGHILKTLSSYDHLSLSAAFYDDPPSLENVHYYTGIDVSSLGWWELINRKFDIIICTEVIEHLICPYNLIRGLAHLCGSNSMILMTFPNVHSLQSKVRYFISGRYSGFFGPNLSHTARLFDQHIFIPNHLLVKYFLLREGLHTESLVGVNGCTLFFSKTVGLKIVRGLG